MRPTGKLKMVIMAIVVILSCGTANAQRLRRYHYPYRVVTVVSRPAVTVHVSNRFTQGKRFRMAMAYLDEHEYLTVKRYAKMTELSKAAAKAELDAFVADKDKPITAVIRDRKKVYVMRDRN